MANESEKSHRARNIVVGFMIGIVLLVIGAFVWRVAFYLEGIKSGTFVEQDLSFLQAQTISRALAAVPVADTLSNVATTDDPSLGSEQAPITIVEFADFGCPYSQTASYTMRSLAMRYADTIRYVYRDFPVSELNPQSVFAAEAAECAADQGRFWDYHDKLYTNQSDLRREKLVQFARELSLKEEQFVRCLDMRKHQKEVQEDYDAGVAAGVRGTPTFFLNGYRIPGAIPEKVLDQLIQQML